MSRSAALRIARRGATVLGAAILLLVVAAPLPGWFGGDGLAVGSRAERGSGVAVPGDLDRVGDPTAAEAVPDVAPVPEIATHPALLSEQPASPAPPVGITLPTLGVAALVDAVGVDPGGELAVPPSATVAAWYRGGPTPTSPSGSSVIAAHVDHGGRQGVFFRLARLRPGDPVSVTNADGTSSSFVVVSTTSYVKADLPTGEMFRRDGDPVLTLITCGGEFRHDERSYADNVVVRAAPVPG